MNNNDILIAIEDSNGYIFGLIMKNLFSPQGQHNNERYAGEALIFSLNNYKKYRPKEQISIISVTISNEKLRLSDNVEINTNKSGWFYPGKQFNIPQNRHGKSELLGDTKTYDFKIQDIEVFQLEI